MEYVRDKTDLKLVFLLKRNITESDWARLDMLDLVGVGMSITGLVTPGCWDQEHRGRYRCATTDFIQQAHDHGLKAHGWTFNNEWMSLYWDHGQDPYSLLEEFYDLGIDGYFADFPLTVR